MRSAADTVKELFPQKTIVVIGDLVADQFLSGTIDRVSREAPVFILRHDETETVPGAAANAAANAAALGARTHLIGIVGDDENGRLLIAALDRHGVEKRSVITADGRSTTTKVRILAAQAYAPRQQVIRVDYEDGAKLDELLRKSLVREVKAAVAQADAVIISDYGYGVVSDDVFEAAREMAALRLTPIIVDSRHRLGDFRGADAATPNREEIEQLLGPDFSDTDCSRLREKLGLKALLVTNGNKGMTLFRDGTAPALMPAVGATEPIDVTGAGDTVIAAFSLALASGLDYRAAAEIANHAGGIVVMKKRTATVTPDELARSLSDKKGETT